MRYDISGTVMQTVSINLDPGEVLISQPHAMAWMTDGVTMNTHTGGGLWAGLKRAMTGGSLFITEYGTDRRAQIAFAPRFPGQIIAVPLAPGQSLICRKETFLVAERSVSLEIAFQQRFGAGLFAGEGFILQRVTGVGSVFLARSGEVVEQRLGPGARLRVPAARHRAPGGADARGPGHVHDRPHAHGARVADARLPGRAARHAPPPVRGRH